MKKNLCRVCASGISYIVGPTGGQWFHDLHPPDGHEARPLRITYCYDTEFLEDGKTIELISIGIVREDGSEYYAVNQGSFPMWCRVSQHPWLVANVLPTLPMTVVPALHVKGDKSGISTNILISDRSNPQVKPLDQIAQEVYDFLTFEGTEPELWAWYAAFDHVALAWLYGPMSRMPEPLPYYTNDIKQECVRLGDPEIPEHSGNEHHALADARQNWVIKRFLNECRPVV